MHNVIEQSIEVKKDLNLCFIDYSKAFGKIQHKEMFAILNKLDVDGKTL